METLTLNVMRRNAYRVLGLTGRATQEEIEAAARMLRLLAGSDAPPTPNDAAWLGPVIRTGVEVDSALTRLSNPESRINERLWWYCNPPPATDQMPPPPVAATGAVSVQHRHDGALTTLSQLLILGTDKKSLNQWRDLLSEFRAVGRSDTFLQWMLAVERKGDFEKTANLEELAQSQSQLPEIAASGLVAMADDCISDNDYAGAGQVMEVLRDAAGDRHGSVGTAVDRILNRFEDALVGRCNECISQVDEAWKTKRIDRLKPACSRALIACEGNLKGIARELARNLADDADRLVRIRGQLVNVYTHVADAYEACHDKYSSRQALMKSLDLAAGSPAEPRIKQRIESLTGARPTREPVVSGGGGGGGGGSGYRPYWLLIVVLIGVIRACASMSSSSTSNSPTFNTPPNVIPISPEIMKQLQNPNVPRGEAIKSLMDPGRSGPAPAMPQPSGGFPSVNPTRSPGGGGR